MADRRGRGGKTRGRGGGKRRPRGNRSGKKGNTARHGQASSSSVNDTKSNNSGKRNLAIFEGVSEDFRIKRKTQLENFRENDKEDEIIFGNSLTNHERRYVHALAGQLGLVSKSYGKGESRYLTVRKTKKKDNKALSIVQKIRFRESNIQKINVFMQRNADMSERFVKDTFAHPGGRVYNIRNSAKPRLAAEASGSRNSHHKPKDAKTSPMFNVRSKLPAWALKDNISKLIEENQVVVLSGETGCGKSTQVPQFILDSIKTGAPCNILVSQPRRISAMGLAERVAAERGESVGETVGYSVRLESRSSPKTELLYCTTGVLLRKLNTNPLLNGVTHVVVDEVHERSHFSDFLLIILREILKKRQDLRVVLMSATLERGLFQEYFNNCPCIEIEGRTFPVDHFFLEDVFIQTQFMGPIQSEEKLPQDASKLNKDSVKSNQKMAQEDKNVEDVDISSINLDLDEREEGASNTLNADVLSALNAIDEWDETDPNNFCETNNDLEQLLSALGDNNLEDNQETHPDSDEELAAARLAVSRVDKGIMGSNNNGRSMSVVMDEYIQSSDESVVDITLVLSLLEYICLDSHARERGGHDYVSSLSITRNGKKCLGGILVFLSGWSDISQLLEILKVHQEFGNASKFRVLPLHGGIAPASQRLVFKSVPPGVRKIVLATNIAETSITIDDIVVVIDGGKVKEKLYDPYTQMSSLATAFVSHASAMQRKGRAGRVQRGKCYTLMSKSRFEALNRFQVPELLRTPLEELCLQIKLLCGESMSIQEFLANAPEEPQEIAVRDAIIALKRIGALNKDEKLTMLGYYLAKIPLEPRLGRMAIMSIPFGCFEHIVSICCSLGYRDPFMIPIDNKGKVECDEAKLRFSCQSNSDHIANIFALKGYQDALRKNGESGIFGYCRRNYLSHSTMRMIHGMKMQTIDQFKQLGLLNSNAEAWKHANRYATNTDVLKTVLAFGLYPNLLRRLPTHKNFQGRGNRKCRVQKSSVSQLKGGILSDASATEFTWICFGEMLKGDRSEVVRDATVLSPVSILFCTGSPYEGNREEHVEEEQSKTEKGPDSESSELPSTDIELYIDEGVKFMIDKSIIYPVEVLRGLVHTALESTIVHKKYDAIQRKVILEGVDTIVAVLNDGHRSSADILPNHSGFQQGRFRKSRGNERWKKGTGKGKGYEPRRTKTTNQRNKQSRSINRHSSGKNSRKSNSHS